jgi:hypothetical protein
MLSWQQAGTWLTIFSNRDIITSGLESSYAEITELVAQPD